MEGSIERVRQVLRGEIPDRAPLYELLRNDTVLSYFAGEELTVENGPEVVFRAYAPAIDATRPRVRVPDQERVEVLEDGRQRRYYRWTTWTERNHYPDGEAWAAAKHHWVAAFDPGWNAEKQEALDSALTTIADYRRRLGEVFFFPSGPYLSLTDIYDEVGLEQFSYCLTDYPELIGALLECHTLSAISWIEHLPEGHGIEGVFAADDIAYKSGPLLRPGWFDEHYFSRMARITAAYQKRGIRVLFHSDGNLNPILDGLVEAGIDGLNPIEILADMDVGDIHRRYPRLFLTGGIDVSQLLPFGSPQEVKEAVYRAIDAAEGRIMIGSTSELHKDVPLANYLALREAVLERPYR